MLSRIISSFLPDGRDARIIDLGIYITESEVGQEKFKQSVKAENFICKESLHTQPENEKNEAKRNLEVALIKASTGREIPGGMGMIRQDLTLVTMEMHWTQL